MVVKMCVYVEDWMQPFISIAFKKNDLNKGCAITR
jgi:hypothetical protein